MLKADETLDFHNKQIEVVALGEKCPNKDQSCAYILTSPLGHVYTTACPAGLHCVKLYGDTSYDDIKWNTKVDFIRASSLMPSNKHVKQLKLWLQAYFKDPLKSEEIDLSFCGLEEYGDFNSKVWMAIRDTCPPGELMSYRELGERAGYGSGASKVVGYAINKNPYMLVVGDHRVVTSSGQVWCENESQRNKLRRLLVNYEIPFTGKTLDEALAKVRDRNASTKGTRKSAGTKSKSTAAKTRVKKEPGAKPKGRGVQKKSAPKRKSSRRRKADDETDESEMDDDDIEDDDDE